MQTTQTPVTVRTLEPEPGFFLTQADSSIPISQKIVSKKIYLAVSDSPDNWREISQEEADAIIEAQEAERRRIDEAVEADNQDPV